MQLCSRAGHQQLAHRIAQFHFTEGRQQQPEGCRTRVKGGVRMIHQQKQSLGSPYPRNLLWRRLVSWPLVCVAELRNKRMAIERHVRAYVAVSMWGCVPLTACVALVSVCVCVCLVRLGSWEGMRASAEGQATSSTTTIPYASIQLVGCASVYNMSGLVSFYADCRPRHSEVPSFTPGLLGLGGNEGSGSACCRALRRVFSSPSPLPPLIRVCAPVVRTKSHTASE